MAGGDDMSFPLMNLYFLIRVFYLHTGGSPAHARAVIPAKAGIYRAPVDSRLRGNDIGLHYEHGSEPK